MPSDQSSEDTDEPFLPDPCPHCGAPLVGEWLDVSVSWTSDGVIDSEVNCPNCGLDITDTTDTDIDQGDEADAE